MKTYRSAAILALLILLVAAACAPSDPVELLNRARRAHEVELISMNTWDRPAEPTAEQAPVPEEQPADTEAVDATESEPEADSGVLGILALRVTDRGSPVVLECLTIDVVFQAGTPEKPVDLGSERVELEIEGLREVGGTLEFSRRFNLPAGTAQVEVDLAEVTDEQLLTLCEARTIVTSSP